MTRDVALNLLQNGLLPQVHGAYRDALEMAIEALKLVNDFESAQIITGGRLNGRTYAYKCGLSDGQRLAKGEKIFNVLPSVQPEPRWIPVSEKLPEDRQAVLVWCPQYKNIYCAYLEKEQWWIFGAFVQIVPNEVIAWMPLPEPYKAESEDME